jgi:hypothetical protein
MKLKTILENGFIQARREPDFGRVPGEVHWNRSQCFVEKVGQLLKAVLPADGYAVFHGRCLDNRTEFDRNEFLCDIAVYRTARLPDEMFLGNTPFICAMEWCIESEFEESDQREMLKDFSKLLVVDAHDKLYIAPMNEKREWFRTMLHHVAKSNRRGNIWLAQMPHPRDWRTSDDSVALFGHGDIDWEPTDGPEIRVDQEASAK